MSSSGPVTIPFKRVSRMMSIGIWDALRDAIELRFRKALADEDEQRAQRAAHLRLAQPESLLQLRNDARSRLGRNGVRVNAEAVQGLPTMDK